MFGIGIGEILLIIFVALLVFGPERLPSLARQLGKIFRELRTAGDELKYSFFDEDRGPSNILPIKKLEGPISRGSPDLVSSVISAQAGNQANCRPMDSRLHGNDENGNG